MVNCVCFVVFLQIFIHHGSRDDASCLNVILKVRQTKDVSFVVFLPYKLFSPATLHVRLLEDRGLLELNEIHLWRLIFSEVSEGNTRFLDKEKFNTEVPRENPQGVEFFFRLAS